MLQTLLRRRRKYRGAHDADEGKKFEGIQGKDGIEIHWESKKGPSPVRAAPESKEY